MFFLSFFIGYLHFVCKLMFWFDWFSLGALQIFGILVLNELNDYLFSIGSWIFLEIMFSMLVRLEDLKTSF